MINFKNIEKIVTHSGHAHRDDFLSVCFTLAMCKEENNLPILQRRDPTDADLNNPNVVVLDICLLYTSPSPRDRQKSRMPSSA